jgi:G3E family GTPase
MTMIKKVRLDTLVTVVDGGAFLRLFGGDSDVSKNVDLAVAPGDAEGLRALEAEGSGVRKITELLLEQVECADIVVVNKADLLKSEAEVRLVEKVIRSVNPTAQVLSCTKVTRCCDGVVMVLLLCFLVAIGCHCCVVCCW